MNNVCYVGRLTAEPQLKFEPVDGGDAYASSWFILAIDRDYDKKTKEERIAKNLAVTDFPKIMVYGRQAENLAQYCTKGSLVSVVATTRTGSYQKNNETIYSTDFVAKRIKFLDNRKKSDMVIDESEMPN